MNEKLYQALAGNLDEFRSIPFWSWNNSLDEKELVRQIEEMKRVGIGGFIMHARTGLKEEYLGEKWFSCIDACLKKAKELNMEAWVYDENGWPSGFVGGKLLEVERFRARYLEYSVGKYDETAFATFIPSEEAGFLRVTSPCEGVKEYHNVYLRVSPANTDILNPEVTDAFIQETHEKYYARFHESFGRELKGFFTDEPQYYRWATAYTPLAEAEFAKNGEDVRDGLIWLFNHDERGFAFRQKYYHTLNSLYVHNFYKKLYDWCHAHHCMLTGHTLEESAPSIQMWGCADVMTSYEYEDIPGIDWLGRLCGTEIAPKQVGSVASQLGKKCVLTETFACSGNDVTPRELKGIGEMQYFHGVNKMCQHLYPYSMAGRGKTDHPPVFGRQSNWYEAFATFNEYFTRLGYIVGNTEENVDVAIVHPIRDAWLKYVHHEGSYSAHEVDHEIFLLMEQLRQRGICYHFIDEQLLSQYGSNEKGALRVGKRVYHTVLVPKMSTLAHSTYELLKNFDGKLCTLGTPTMIDGKKTEVCLRGNLSFEELLASGAVSFTSDNANTFITSRSGEIGDFLFIKNISATEGSRITMKGVAEHYRALDLERLTERDISNEMVLGAGDSLVLVKTDKASSKTYKEQTTEITSGFQMTEITENYLVMDYAQMKKEGGTFGEKFPVSGLFEELLRQDYKGNVTIRQTFVLTEKMPLKLTLERADYQAVTLNGNPVTFQTDDFDVNFITAEVGEFAQKGENELVYSLYFYQHDGVHFALFDPLATESLRNCLYYDTSIETSYLKGAFVVNEDHSLSPQTCVPQTFDNLQEKGYPFFKGEITLRGQFDYQTGKQTYLQLGGRYLVAKAFVNGNEADLIMNDRTEITPFLKDGKNEMKIIVRSSLRNLFGPHHFKPEADPVWVSPYNFDFRGEWVDGKLPEDYTHTYHSVPFGVNRVLLVSVTEK